MKIPAFDETDIICKDDVLTITQFKGYTSNTVTMPIEMWPFVSDMVDEVIAHPEEDKEEE